jgi:O-antigen/teichoic acid export membrane protein
LGNIIKAILVKIGIDEVIAFTIVGRIVQAAGGIIALLLVAHYLTETEQGYYYTFGSILAIQFFFELGLSNIIIQFVSHESVKLQWIDQTSFNGPAESCSRLASLLRFSVKWFFIVGGILIFGLLLSGYYFFNIYGEHKNIVDWQIPWIILSISTSFSLIVSPILTFLEGLGRIKEVAKIKMVQQITQVGFILLFFSLGFKLYSSPLAAFISFIIITFWIFQQDKRRLLYFVWNKLGQWKVNYKSEIFPIQWKIAMSWISGYFIFQLFNPVLFATEGPVVAGQMGMTLAVLNAILMLSLSWMTTKVAVFSRLIANKEYVKLDILFNKTLLQSSLVNFLALSVFLFLIFLIRYFSLTINGKYFGDRFLPYLPMIFMMIPLLLNHLIAAWATYLRCHKKEPMLLQSVVIGVLCSISTIFFGKHFGVIGMTVGYTILTTIGFFWTLRIFRTKKREWNV